MGGEVTGHAPHRPRPMGFHKSEPIFYGLDSFSFRTLKRPARTVPLLGDERLRRLNSGVLRAGITLRRSKDRRGSQALVQSVEA